MSLFSKLLRGTGLAKLFGFDKKPEIYRQDPEAEAERASQKATLLANQELAAKRQRKASTLLESRDTIGQQLPTKTGGV